MNDEYLADLVQKWLHPSVDMTEEEHAEAIFRLDEQLPEFTDKVEGDIVHAGREEILRRIVSYRKGLRVLAAGENVEIIYPFSERENSGGGKT